MVFPYSHINEICYSRCQVLGRPVWIDFFLAFEAFVQMFYLNLYIILEEFMHLLRSYETCSTIMLNKFDFGKINRRWIIIIENCSLKCADISKINNIFLIDQHDSLDTSGGEKYQLKIFFPIVVLKVYKNFESYNFFSIFI